MGNLPVTVFSYPGSEVHSRVKVSSQGWDVRFCEPRFARVH